MIKESLKLGNFKKMFPLSLFSTIFLLLATYGMNRGIASQVDLVVSLAAFFIGLLGFIFLYATTYQVAADELTASLQEEEAPSVAETIKGWKSYVPSAAGVVITFFLVYQFVLPIIGSIAGGLFQVSILGISLNLLTFALNLMAVTWLIFGLVSISTIGTSYKETFSYVLNFVFTNFRKVVLFLIIGLLLMYGVLVLLVHTMLGNQLMLLPIKAIAMAYVFGFLTVYATNLFVDNVSDDDFAEPEDAEEEDAEE